MTVATKQPQKRNGHPPVSPLTQGGSKDTNVSRRRRIGDPTAETMLWFARRARAPRHRTMRRFAEEEIVIPTGPFAGRKYQCKRQPFTRLYFDAVEELKKHGINKYFATGPVQSAKSNTAYVTPILYHLFESKETVICGIPTMDIALDKWSLDILPVIQRTKYRDYLPVIGKGSKGGKSFESVTFTHGVTLKFMSAGGGDEKRSSFTSRVVVMTEIDKFDQQGGSSREADKVTQIIARTKAYAEAAAIYGECTVSLEEGRIWTEIVNGTDSRIALRCPVCKSWCVPSRDADERKLLIGWQEAETVIDAREHSRFICAKCGEPWSEDQRRTVNENALLVHKGQEIDKKGRVVGDLPRTDTMGFRWGAINNLFRKAADVGADEWRAARATDEENAEKEMRQFVWALPYEPPTMDAAPLKEHEIMRRVRSLPRGIVPEDTLKLVGHVDLHKYLAYYMIVAFSPAATGHIVDYDVLEVDTDQLGLERGLATALKKFHDLAETGWGVEGGGTYTPDQVWIDAGWPESKEVVYSFCRGAMNARYKPTFGRGSAQHHARQYNKPTKTGGVVGQIGEEYHLSHLKNDRVWTSEVNADYWKSFAHHRLRCPVDSDGALTLFDAPPTQHLKLAKHLTAEKQVEEYVPGKGILTYWKRERRANHWLDNLYNCYAAAHFQGIKLIQEPVLKPLHFPVPQALMKFETPDGRAFTV